MGSILNPPPAYVPSDSPYEHWSPLQLAHACGVRIDLRSRTNGERVAYIGERAVSHAQAFAMLSEQAAALGIDSATPPANARRALQNGKDVTPC